ncbi:MAG: Hsp20/alpha crystallin family protein [Acidobacteria bacterium]|nr:Hsp20/alpha crystallin family protein [Acidobacteriota bacterium]
MLFDWLHPLTAYRLMDELTPKRQTMGPLMNMYRNEETARIDVRVPGFDPSDIEISVEDDVLRVTGSAPEIERQGQVLRRERGPVRFDRRIRIPFRIDDSNVEAHYKNGMLHVMLHMHESEKPRVIPVKTA